MNVPAGQSALNLARLLALAVPAALLGGAYISQYGFGLFPCEMCWWQRYPHFIAIALVLPAFALPRARWPVALAALAIGVSGLIGLFHGGVEYHWWQGFTACTSEVSLAGADPLAAILNAPMIRCDQAQWTMLGISLAGFNFLFSGLGALLVFALLLRSRKDTA